ncbi:hypothetical protein [Synechococcus sp. BA-132 BA5]|uniref:hypothetical protein n=1 Tax=Synechococcus sp. BA-132 BA5 TaxID=3110252 RepID=UPI002B1FC279|nr:hypothetical protein [Synechococcus sp. BA-132 BA5]MEA5417027.1 hypothetical protein [Synechococcus sp. BA-132 BA5]
MTVGELYLESLSSGIITPTELSWLTHGQNHFSRLEEATALRLGRLLDQGDIQLGCRLVCSDTLAPQEAAAAGLEEWVEPLGRQPHR